MRYWDCLFSYKYCQFKKFRKFLALPYWYLLCKYGNFKGVEVV
jgi:hypothetical protein